MNRNDREKLKRDIKLAIRRLFPPFILRHIRRRQVPLKKMQKFLAEDRALNQDLLKENPSLAIVVPCYKHAKYIEQAFDSIIKQTRLPDEVIFIDDCSPDETGHLLGQLIDKYVGKNKPAIKFSLLKNEKNMGQALTINKGIDEARSDLVMILNDDDYLIKDAVETVLNFFQSHPHLALVGGNYITFYGTEKPNGTEKTVRELAGKMDFKISWPSQALEYENYCDLNMAHSGSTFVKEKANSAGLYRAKKNRLVPGSDRDFQIRVNLLYPVGTGLFPLCFWRYDSSVDSGINS